MRAILTYHSIDASGSPVSLPEDSFRAHARFLSSGAVAVVPLADLPGRADDEDAVALTFDDAFLNFETTALPILRDHALPATLFVVTDRVGRDNAWGDRPAPGIPVLPLMNWDQLAAVVSSGVEVGAHTRRHPDLTTVSDAELADEVEGSAEAIRAVIGRKPDRFAYPYGAVSDRVRRVARNAFQHSCTTEFRALAATEDRALLPRLDAWYFRAAGQLEQWGTAPFRRRIWIRAQGRRVRRLVSASLGRVA